MLTGGELKRLIEEDGLRGMTSNPAIFEKAITGSTLYDDLLNSLRSRTDLDAKGRYEILAIRDIQDAADFLRPVYQSSKRRDGYVSLEVRPISPAIPRARSRRRAGCGRPSAARM